MISGRLFILLWFLRFARQASPLDQPGRGTRLSTVAIIALIPQLNRDEVSTASSGRGKTPNCRYCLTNHELRSTLSAIRSRSTLHLI